MRCPLFQRSSARFPTTELPRCLRLRGPRTLRRVLATMTAAVLSFGCAHPAIMVRPDQDVPRAPVDVVRVDQGTDRRVAPDSTGAFPCDDEAPPARRLKLLTFNLWTIELPVPRFVFEDSKDIDSRLQLLPEKVLQTGADILVFQEVWREQRKVYLIERFRKLGYPYSIHNRAHGGLLERGALGNGLLIISKYPLSEEPRLLRFSRYTRAIEYFARKGAIKTSVSVPGLGWVDLVDAHLGSIGTEKTNGRADHFNGHNLSILSHQVRELIRFITRSKSSGIVLAAMDINTHYQTLAHGSYQATFAPEYAMLTCAGLTPAARASADSCLGLVDTFRRIHGFETEPAWTYDTRSNRYAGNGVFADEPPGVLDYIFVNDNPRLVPVSSEVVFKERPTEMDRTAVRLDARTRLPAQVSDHYGVLTTFDIRG